MYTFVHQCKIDISDVAVGTASCGLTVLTYLYPPPPYCCWCMQVHAAECRGHQLMKCMRVDPKILTCCTAWQELGMPFKKWLEKHGLNLILPLFYETQTSQGYGYIEEVPTYYGTAQSSLHCT